MLTKMKGNIIKFHCKGMRLGNTGSSMLNGLAHLISITRGIPTRLSPCLEDSREFSITVRESMQ